jgi:hypothetical protein
MATWDLVRGGYEVLLGGWMTVSGLWWAVNFRGSADAVSRSNLVPRHLVLHWRLDVTWWRFFGLAIFGSGLTMLGFGFDHLGMGPYQLLMLMGIPITIIGWAALLLRPDSAPGRSQR